MWLAHEANVGNNAAAPREGMVTGPGLRRTPWLIVSIISPLSKSNRTKGIWTKLLLFCVRPHNVEVDLVKTMCLTSPLFGHRINRQR